MSKKISLSTVWLQGTFGDEKALEIAAEAGFDGVDFSTHRYGDDPYWNHWNSRPDDFEDVFQYPPEKFEEYFTKLREKAKSLGLEIFQTHGRVSGYGNNPECNSILKLSGEKDLLAAKYLGSPYTVIHSVTTILMGYDTPPSVMHSLNNQMYMDLEKAIDETGVKVSLETFGNARIGEKNGIDFFAIPEEFTKTFNQLPKDKFVLCLDTGHSNVASSFGYPTPAELVKLYGDNIKLLHLHDNHSVIDEHNLPFTGNIDWNLLMQSLDDVGYDGAYNFEVNLERFGSELIVDTTKFLSKIARELVK